MSNSGLYGNVGNISVRTNDTTTLYNTTATTVKTSNVADRNFTTLYTQQSDIKPTLPYGNANVEAFLNAGTDGANSVQNIQMSGNITVGGSNSTAQAAQYGTTATTEIDTNEPWVTTEQQAVRLPAIKVESNDATDPWNMTAMNWQATVVEDAF